MRPVAILLWTLVIIIIIIIITAVHDYRAVCDE